MRERQRNQDSCPPAFTDGGQRNSLFATSEALSRVFARMSVLYVRYLGLSMRMSAVLRLCE